MGVISGEVKSEREILSDKVQHEVKVSSGEVQSEETAPAQWSRGQYTWLLLKEKPT